MNLFAWLSWLFHPKTVQRSGGVIPQTSDSRDLKYLPSGGIDPVGVDLREWFKSVQDQNGYNACTAFAIGGLVDYLATHNLPNWDFDFSEAYQWYWARMYEGTVEENTGVVLRNQFRVLKNMGVVDNRYWSFKDGWNKTPSLQAQSAAVIQRDFMTEFTGEYRSVNVDNIEQALSEGLPVVFAIGVDESFLKLKSDTCHVSLFLIPLFYHAMLIVGYNETEFIVRNSWGKKWGESGYCYINKELLRNKAFDLWTITQGQNTVVSIPKVRKNNEGE